MAVFKRILHPSDFSPASAPAFAEAVEAARANDARLLIMHVLAPVTMVPDVFLATRIHEPLLRDHRAQAQTHLDRLAARAKRRGVRASTLLLDFAVAHERIVQVAKTRRAHLIVMGTHGRTGFSKMALGSVAERVVALAPCPVLTVRARTSGR